MTCDVFAAWGEGEAGEVTASIQSVSRAASLLRLLAAHQEPMALSHLAASVELPKGTTHGLLRTLVEVGFVEQDIATGLYALGPDLPTPGSVRLDRNELRSAALNWSDALAAHTGEAVLVATFDSGEAVIAHHVFRPDRSAQRLVTNGSLPLHASAQGKVLLAHDPRAARRVTVKGLEALTHRTITDRVRLGHDLAHVRDHGWIAAVEEAEPNMAGIAAPIRNRGGYVLGAIGIYGAVEQVCDGRSQPRRDLTQQVVKAGRSISRELGHGQDL